MTVLGSREAVQTETSYQVCNRLMDVEDNRYCEFDGQVEVRAYGFWTCPWCGYNRMAHEEGVDL